MNFRISLTPTADRSAKKLRGKAADRFHRALVCFPDSESIVILLVGEHRRGHPGDIYGSIYELLGIAEPEARRAKPPCCDDEGEPPVDPDLVDRFRASANRLRRGR